MKRVFIVGLVDDKDKTLEFIRGTGVLHVEPINKLTGGAESRSIAIVQEMRRTWRAYESVKGFAQHKKMIDIPLTVDEVLPFCERQLAALSEARTRRMTLEKMSGELLEWGDFDPSILSELEKDGVFVQRFRAHTADIDEHAFSHDTFLQIVSRKPVPHFFTITTGAPIELPWARLLKNPEMSLTDAAREIRSLADKEEEIDAELAGVRDRVEVLKSQYINLLNEANYTECLGSLYEEELLFGLQGWIPLDIEDDFFRQAAGTELAVTVTTRDPGEDEKPPVLLRSNWIFERIRPLMRLYGLPDYRSIDPSYFFAPFMILFFGICLGDAGYGAVFWLASLLIEKYFGSSHEGLPLVMKLCRSFSLAAIVIGIITGSVFGYNFESRQWIVVDIHQEFGDPMILFYASLALGLIHLTISYLMGIVQSVSRIDRLQKAGLLGVLWGGAILISRAIWFSEPTLQLNLPLYYSGLVFLAAGVFLNLFFASEDKNWVIRLGLGLFNVYGLTGLVGDLLSYARLFGLGIATTAIASVMNTLAGMVYQAAGPVIGVVLAVLILILGHTFNLVLSILGSVVHSARLHFVEAFKNFYQGGGTEYKPFKVKRGS